MSDTEGSAPIDDDSDLYLPTLCASLAERSLLYAGDGIPYGEYVDAALEPIARCLLALHCPGMIDGSMLRRAGTALTVYARGGSVDRPWPVDLIILAAAVSAAASEAVEALESDAAVDWAAPASAAGRTLSGTRSWPDRELSEISGEISRLLRACSTGYIEGDAR